MIVYGDRSRRVESAAIHAALARAEASSGTARHAALTTAFLDLAAMAQAIADEGFARRGFDAPCPATDAIMAALTGLAGEALRAWRGEPRTGPPIRLPPLPARVVARVPEGHAYYALHPEAYAAAAQRLVLDGPPRVIGIRSIGAGLAAMAAAALGAPPPITVRPTGHPFARRIAAGPGLLDALLDGAPGAHIVIADEGPGLSGSSFGAVADWLEARGIPRRRIAFLPSHGGDPGPQASAAHRARWAAAQRPVVPPDDLLAGRLEAWAEELLGPLDAPMQDISGGAWRALVYGPDQSRWPAAMPLWERRKFLLRAGGRPVLLRFAGLAAIGEAKLGRAQALHAAGLTPEPRGLVNGWLVEAWIEGPRRAPDLRRLGQYIGTRARLFADADDGADPETLLSMARHNAILALGERRAAALDAWLPQLAALAAAWVPTITDNRILPAEWAGSPSLKTDAHDHAEAHDLIGCQDPAWDVAGAAAEFGYAAGETEALRRAAAEDAGRPIDAALTRFLRPCHLAFRMGQHRLSADGLGDWPDERARNEAAFARYAALLAAALSERP